MAMNEIVGLILVSIVLLIILARPLGYLFQMGRREAIQRTFRELFLESKEESDSSNLSNGEHHEKE